jgi:hypothetical protein
VGVCRCDQAYVLLGSQYLLDILEGRRRGVDVHEVLAYCRATWLVNLGRVTPRHKDEAVIGHADAADSEPVHHQNGRQADRTRSVAAAAGQERPAEESVSEKERARAENPEFELDLNI